MECLKRNVKGRGMGTFTCFYLDKVVPNEADINFKAPGVYSVCIIRKLLFHCKYYLTINFNENFLKICM